MNDMNDVKMELETRNKLRLEQKQSIADAMPDSTSNLGRPANR